MFNLLEEDNSMKSLFGWGDNKKRTVKFVTQELLETIMQAFCIVSTCGKTDIGGACLTRIYYGHVNELIKLILCQYARRF